MTFSGECISYVHCYGNLQYIYLPFTGHIAHHFSKFLFPIFFRFLTLLKAMNYSHIKNENPQADIHEEKLDKEEEGRRIIRKMKISPNERQIKRQMKVG